MFHNMIPILNLIIYYNLFVIKIYFKFWKYLFRKINILITNLIVYIYFLNLLLILHSIEDEHMLSAKREKEI